MPPSSVARWMPVKCRRCTRSSFTTDYSPGDVATLLQSGGVELLDVKTLMALRQMESVIRWGLSDMQRYQKLSDELIMPNLDQDISSFTIRPQRNCESVLRSIPKLWKQP